MKKTSAVLESKTRIPRSSSSFLRRSRLLEKLDNEEEKLVVLNAAAGYGKSVLLAHYARYARCGCAWYHLGSTDNDLMVFVQYLCVAIKRVVPAFDFDAVGWFGYMPDEERMYHNAQEFALQLSAAAEDGLVLVLDDFQEINSEQVHAFIGLLLQFTPERIRFFISTKGAPPRFLPSYQLKGMGTLITREDMCFRTEEVDEIFRDLVPEAYITTITRTVQEKTEGWPAGVMFTVLYFQQQRVPVSDRDLAVLYNRSTVHDYFLHEIYSKLSFDLQQFLVHTSVLDFLAPDICNSIMGITDAHSILQYLEQENLFLYQMGTADRFYRYHLLFREFLQAQLRPQLRQELLDSAAAFYLRTNNKEQSVEYAMTGGNLEMMQYAMETVGDYMLEQGKLATLGRWIAYLEAKEVNFTAQNMLIMGRYYYRTGSPARAMSCIEQALPMFLSAMDERGYSRCMLEKAKLLRDVASHQESLEILHQLSKRFEGRKTDLRYEAASEIMYDMVLLSDYQAARRLSEEMLVSARKEGNRRAEYAMLRCRAAAGFFLGEYAQAVKDYQEAAALEIEGDSRAALRERLSADMYIAIIKLFAADFTGAEEIISREVERRHSKNIREDLWLIYLVQAVFYRLHRYWRTPACTAEEAEQRMNSALEKAERHATYFKENRVFRDYVLLLSELEQVFKQNKISRTRAAEMIAVAQTHSRLTGEIVTACLVHWYANAGEDSAVRRFGQALLKKAEQETFFTAMVRMHLIMVWQREGNEAEAVSQARQFFTYASANNLFLLLLLSGRTGVLVNIAMQGRMEPALVESLTQSEDPSRQLRVNCFGAFEAWLPGEKRPIKWRTKKALELFAFLFHLQGQPVEKERLLVSLWPEHSSESATALLHTTLYGIRKQLQPGELDDIIVYGDKRYHMRMNRVRSDYAELEAVCRAAERREWSYVEAHRGAITHYQGSYLHNIDAEWSDSRRNWFETMYIRLCQQLAGVHMGQGRYEEAAQLLKGAIEVDAYAEQLYVLLFECLSMLGDYKNVREYYQRLGRVLRQELDAEPSAQTTAMFDQCMKGGVSLSATV